MDILETLSLEPTTIDVDKIERNQRTNEQLRIDRLREAKAAAKTLQIQWKEEAIKVGKYLVYKIDLDHWVIEENGKCKLYYPTAVMTFETLLERNIAPRHKASIKLLIEAYSAGMSEIKEAIGRKEKG